MTKKPHISWVPALLFGFLIAGILVGCNMPGAASSQAVIDVTQAYQTVQSRLTLAVGQTPGGTPPSLSQENLSPTVTLPPSADSTFTPTASSNNNITDTSTPQVTSQHCDQAAAGYPKIDITVEDDTEFAPGEAFTKIWRVENVGSCTWTTDYSVVFFSGELMGAPSNQTLQGPVPPNQSIDISVNMVAPTQTGTYQGNWKLRNSDGVLFGIGPSGESPFWVRINVVSEVTETPTPTPSHTPTTAVQADGSVSLALNESLDLDTLQVNTGSSDLRYRTTLVDPRHQLVPLIGVTIGVFGASEPGLSDCQSASLASQPVTLDELTIGTYLCHRTDLGLPGWTRFDGFDTDTGAISLQVLTWKMP